MKVNLQKLQNQTLSKSDACYKGSKKIFKVQD